MKIRKNLVIAGLAVAAFASAGAAIAANRPTAKEEQKAVIDDAAKQLGVEPGKLQSALQQALVNRVEQAVKDGRLTRAQADEIIKRINSGDLPLGGPGFGRGDGPAGSGTAASGIAASGRSATSGPQRPPISASPRTSCGRSSRPASRSPTSRRRRTRTRQG